MFSQTVKYQLSTPDKWYAVLNQYLPSRIENSEFIFNESLGKGKLKYLKVQDGLWAQEFHFSLKEELQLQRVANTENDFFLIDFYLSDAEIIRTDSNQTYKQSFENINLVLTSATTTATIRVPANKPIKMFNVLISKKWLFNHVIPDFSNLSTYFNTNDPIYLSENLDYKLKGLLKKIDFEQNNKLTSASNILQIIAYLFERFGNRTLPSSNKSIHPQDLERLMMIKNEMDANPNKEILLANLSVKASMSLSKFKRLFKQVLGTTPYKYHLKNKMEKAMETLLQGDYSVSETGFLLGYSNLSQFSKAFKNHFGMLPSEVCI